VTKEKKHCLTVSAMDGHPTQYESFFVLDIWFLWCDNLIACIIWILLFETIFIFWDPAQWLATYSELKNQVPNILWS
jgi:hypothetical protein